MRYAGFWPRLGASLVDGFVVGVPLGATYLWVYSFATTSVLVALTVFLTMLGALYQIYFTGRWGQTIGKMAMEVRVVKLGGSPVTMREGFLRHVVDLVLAIFSSVGIIASLQALSTVDFDSKSLMERITVIHEVRPWWDQWVDRAGDYWIGSELIVLLLNRKRRALHDYIAGTVVVHVERATSAI